MRIFSTLLAGALGLALAASLSLPSQAQQSSKSWGPKHTTYWSTEATGTHDPGKFMEQPAQPPAAQPAAQPGQRLYYQPRGKRVKAPMRMRQPQTRLRQQQPARPPANQGTPPAERGQQPPADTQPSAPPSGQEPMQRPARPGTAPK